MRVEKYTGRVRGKTNKAGLCLGNNAAGRGRNKNMSYQGNAISRCEPGD